MAKIMRETPIAFALTMVICLALFSYCWYIKKLRNRLVSAQVSATPDEPAAQHEKTGIQKEVVDSFPTVRASELLKVNIKDELQCSICLVEYNDTETLRKLPFCGHVFHIPCVDSWLRNQVTCPVCRIELTDTDRNRAKQSSHYRTQASTPNSVTIDILQSRHVATPAWVLVNRPFPLPPATIASDSRNPKVGPESEVGFEERLPGSRNPNKREQGLESGDHEDMPGWGAIFLPKTGFSFGSRSADTAIIESKDCISHSSISERWTTESFSFGSSATASGGTDGGATPRCAAAESVHDDDDVASEIYRRSPQHGHLPLTVSPEHCAFEFLPVVAIS